MADFPKKTLADWAALDFYHDELENIADHYQVEVGRPEYGDDDDWKRKLEVVADVRPELVSFTFGTVHFGMLFVALTDAEAGTSAVIIQLGAPIATLLACMVLREPLGLMRSLGLGISVAGIVVLAAGPTLPPIHSLILLLISATGWAVSNLVVKQIAGISQECGLSTVQLHGGVSMELVQQLYDIFNGQTKIVQTVHWQIDGDAANEAVVAQHLKDIAAADLVDRVLIDSKVGPANGGTGVTFDWNAAHAALTQAAPRLKLITVTGWSSITAARAFSQYIRASSGRGSCTGTPNNALPCSSLAIFHSANSMMVARSHMPSRSGHSWRSAIASRRMLESRHLSRT